MIFLINFGKIIIRQKRIGYNMNVMRQTACLEVIPITVSQLCCPLYLHAGGTGLRLNDGSGLKLLTKLVGAY